MGGLDPRYWGH